MKKLLLSSAAFLLCILCEAQTDFRFADSAAVWNVKETYYGFSSGDIHDDATYTVIGDLFLDSAYYQQITPGIFSSLGFVLVRKDSTGKVFVKGDAVSPDRLIYDFALNKGDTFAIESPVPFFTEPIRVIVDSTDTVSICGIARKRMFVIDDTSSGLAYPDDAWIEGIGSVNNYFLSPFNYATLPEASSYSLLCFTENDETFSFSASCFAGVEVHGARLSSAITLSPNPASTQLRVELTEPTASLKTIQLYAITGKEVLHTQAAGHTAVLNTHQLAAGVYFCRVVLDDGHIVVRKVLIE